MTRMFALVLLVTTVAFGCQADSDAFCAEDYVCEGL